jgi:hypothetical protein
MALTKCFECGHEVSTSATACPNCGAPVKSVAPSVPPSPPPSAPSPPPSPIAGGGLFQRLKSYFLGLSGLTKVGWICLGVGILFSAKYEPAFWGVIIALVLGIIGVFRIPRRDGLILGAAALLTCVTILGFSLAGEARSPREKQFTPKQKLVSELTISFRESLLDDTQVLRIHNPNPQSVDFYLTCHATSGNSSTLFVSVPALQTKEIGFLEGWRFKPGETFEAVCDEEVVWRSEVK